MHIHTHIHIHIGCMCVCMYVNNFRHWHMKSKISFCFSLFLLPRTFLFYTHTHFIEYTYTRPSHALFYAQIGHGLFLCLPLPPAHLSISPHSFFVAYFLFWLRCVNNAIEFHGILGYNYTHAFVSVSSNLMLLFLCFVGKFLKWKW